MDGDVGPEGDLSQDHSHPDAVSTIDSARITERAPMTLAL